MCGRYYIEDEHDIFEMREIIKEVQDKLYGSGTEANLKTGEIFPTNTVPIISNRGAEAMQWGFPKWDNKGVVINARAETAHEKNMFRSSLMQRRCAVPTTGFFEWRDEGGPRKVKYLFRGYDGPMLYLAAIYNMYEKHDSLLPHFCILTADANESMSPYHNRMPVLLRKDELDRWINDGTTADDFLRREQLPLTASQYK